MGLDLLHDSEELLTPELSDSLDSEAEPEALASEPIAAFGLLSEELSGDAGAMYLRQIANHDLLTAPEEVVLAQRLEEGKAAMRQLAIADDTLDESVRLELEAAAEAGDRARQ